MRPTVGVAPGTISLVINQTGLGQTYLNPGGPIPSMSAGGHQVYLTDPIQPASTTPIVYIGAGAPRHPSAQACRVCAGSRAVAPLNGFEQQALVKKLGIGSVLAVAGLGLLTVGAGVFLVIHAQRTKASKPVSGSDDREGLRSKVGTVAHNRSFSRRDLLEYGGSPGDFEWLKRQGYIKKGDGGWYPTYSGWAWIDGK